MTEKNVSHTKWMKRAIFLASLGKNTTSPNPRVGAVILDKNGNLKYSTEFPLTEEDRLNAKSALELAQNDEKYFATLVDSGIDFPMEEVFNVTGFRRFDSFYDPSQDVGTFKFGNHVFNTASVPKGTPRPITKR